jgi:HEPN domain-containing protein
MANGYRRVDLQTLAMAKLQDAKVLLDAGSYSNAYYIAGYSIELALKACISRQIQSETLPDPKFIREVYAGHDLTKLVKLAGLGRAHKDRQDSSPDFAASWAIVVEWSPDTRYIHTDKYSAQVLIEAIQNPENGVLPWIRNYW